MKRILLFAVLFITLGAAAQNVGVGTTAPHSSAALEVQAANKGLLVPRVALTAANQPNPVTAPADALLVYNTATAGTGANALTPGFYYWSATAGRWSSLASATSSNPQSGPENAGFGSWGDCATAANISGYNPAVAANGVAGDEFGTAVSISGNWAIVGAPKRDISGKVDQGAAYLYFFNGTSWAEHSMITAGSDGKAYDYFGASVSISGNYAVVGAHGQDDGVVYDVGAVYLFFYNGTAWVVTEKLTAAPNAAAYDQFGISVGISGQRILIGAHQADVDGITDKGAVYSYYLGNNGWVAQPRITGADATCRYFGKSLAVSGSRLIVGATHFSGGFSASGSAYLFQLLATSLNNPLVWLEQQKLLPSTANMSFARTVAIAGNMAAVCSPTDTDPGVRLYGFATSSWVERQNISSGGYASIALSDNKLLAGLIGSGNGNLFLDIGGLWEYFQTVQPPNGGTGYFGWAVAMDGKRFVISDYGKLSNRGMIYFGKIN